MFYLPFFKASFGMIPFLALIKGEVEVIFFLKGNIGVVKVLLNIKEFFL